MLDTPSGKKPPGGPAVSSGVAACAGGGGEGAAGAPQARQRLRFLDLFLGVCSERITDEGANFVRLLVENRRLDLLPEIRAQYDALQAEAEARVTAVVVSAFPLEAAQLKALEQGLKRRLGREVSLSAQVDPQLLGGAVIRAGDLVIDGSVRGRLADLAAHISH